MTRQTPEAECQQYEREVRAAFAAVMGECTPLDYVWLTDWQVEERLRLQQLAGGDAMNLQEAAR